jgi:hypothetical protein
MGKILNLAFLILITHTIFAQDEGNIVKRERIAKDHGIFLMLGPSFTLGKNIGDYSTGLNVEAGFTKRLNRILSIGPSISYVGFNYDPAKTKAKTAADLYTGVATDINDWHATYDGGGLPANQQFNYGYLLNLKGGNVSLVSVAANIKLNVIPVTDHSRISVYGFIKPFVSIAQRKAVSGKGERYVYEAYVDPDDNKLYYNQGDKVWYPDGYTDTWGPSSTYPALKSKSKVSGGFFVGPGIEINPAKAFSFFGQAAFGYTFPISYVSTESYPKTVASYTNKEFPIVEKGFPSISIQVGASYNF